MENSTPRTIMVDEYNRKVSGWTLNMSRLIASNIPVSNREKKTGMSSRTKKEYSEGAQAEKLKDSLTSRVRFSFGEASRLSFNFSRHGIYLHYGVGRSYVRIGGVAVSGRRLTKREQDRMLKRGDKRKDISKMRVVYGDTSGRNALDWFDVEIKLGIIDLADIAQEYYGDKTMNSVLNKIDKATIAKKI